MSVLERSENLHNKINSFFLVDNSLLLNILFKSDALDILHDYVLESVTVADVIDLNDVRVRKHGNGFGFVFKSAAKFLICEVFLF